MSAGKTIAYIAAAILLIFGVLFILAVFSPQTTAKGGTFLTGIILILVAFGIIWFARRSSAQAAGITQNVTLDIDLPADVQMEKFKCQNCGSPLTKDDIKMVAGAPTVNCPYCGQVYQLTEEPKW